MPHQVESNIMFDVAPLVGAWIEINYPDKDNHSIESLLSWERGLKLMKLRKLLSGILRRSSRGSVD